jgi:hypothetical protein
MGRVSGFAQGRPNSNILGITSASLLFAALLPSALAESDRQPSAPRRMESDRQPSPRPILTCVVQLDDASFRAVFGYSNSSREEVTIPVGVNNTFDVVPDDRGQPIFFRSGVHPGVFDVIFDTRVSWKLGNNIATASASSPRCELSCPLDQGIDMQGQCVSLEQDSDLVVKEDDVRDTGPAFASSQNALDFIVDRLRSKNLGDAQLVGSSGQSSSSSGQSASALIGGATLTGPVFVPHEDGTIETFDDKLALILGGRSGFFTVSDQQVCVRDDGCFEVEESQSAIAATRPSSVTVCDREFCTANSSFANNSTFFGTGYCSRGAETSQSAGGYREDTHWCRKWGFIPWRCTTKSGTNRIALDVAFLGSQLGDRFRSDSKRDVTSLTTKIWSIAFGLSSPPFECTVPVVCASHSASGNTSSRTGPDNRSVFAQTGVGCPN